MSGNGHMPPWTMDEYVLPVRSDRWFWIHSALAIGSALALASPHLIVRAVAAVSAVVNTMAMLRETRW